MKRILTLLIGSAIGYVKGKLEEIAEAIEAKDKPRTVNMAVTLAVTVLCGVGCATLIVALLYVGRRAIISVTAPVIIIAVLVKSYQLNHPALAEPVQKMQPQDTIKLARARADRIYPLMTQTAYLLLTELCQYLPGLIPPFSLSAVVPKVHYEITSSLVVIYHFIVAKGDSEVDCEAIQEILVSSIDQHLTTNTLPLGIKATYTSTDREIFSSLLIDGVYDVGRYYRIDFVITNEAAVARLRGRPDDFTSSVVTPPDSDFNEDSGNDSSV